MLDSIIAAIENNQLEEAVNMLKRIKEQNRGHEKLGQEDTVVITHPSKIPGEMLDSVSFYAAAFGGGDRNASNLRISSLLTGGDALRVIPPWFKKTTGWMGRDEFSLLMYETLVEVDLAGDKLEELPLPYLEEEGMLRERLLFSGEIATIDAPLTDALKAKMIYVTNPKKEDLQCQP